MIQSNLQGTTNDGTNQNGNVIDIEKNSTTAGARLDAYPTKVGPSLNFNNEPPFAPNQSWEIVADPAGSTHWIIKNPATGFCIDISENSRRSGAPLDAWPVKSKDNENQLWDFLPDPFGSGSCFIQNPQTGYVIEIENGSSASGAALVVKPRRLFSNQHQLWSAVEEGTFAQVPFPMVSMAAIPTSAASDFGSNNQYVLLAPDQSTNIKSFAVIIDVIEDIVASSFTVQINGNAPTPTDGTGTKWDAQWSQFGLLVQNNSLQLFNQAWHALGPDKPGDPLASVTETSGSMWQIQNNTIPAGTRIVLTLTIDANNDNFVTAVVGNVLAKGVPVGTKVPWSLIGQPTFNPGGPVQESDLSPFGAVSVVFAGLPGGNTNFSAGMGTITVISDPAVTVSSQLNGPNPHGIQTAEQSNYYYGQVPEGSFKQVVQPFGMLAPKIKGATGVGVTSVFGSGLYPNSKLTVTAKFSSDDPAHPVEGSIPAGAVTAGNDGSFAFDVIATNPAANYSLSVTVADSQGNSAWGHFAANVTDSTITTSATGGTPRPNW
jgi:hypothetical protein